MRSCEAGTLRIPLPSEGPKAAWIVDGQQRSIALSQARDKSFPVPVVAFVSEELSVHREQFILVNKAKPLDPRLIDELLPEVDTIFPRDLSSRKFPSELVNRLHTSPDSPFQGLIQRPSDDSTDAVVTRLRADQGDPQQHQQRAWLARPLQGDREIAQPTSMPCTKRSSPIGAPSAVFSQTRGDVRRPKAA